MSRHRLSLIITGPTILLSLLILGLCTATAIYLYDQQANSVAALSESVGSRKVASDLEVYLTELIALLEQGGDPLEWQNERIRERLKAAGDLFDDDEARPLLTQLRASFDQYQKLRNGRTAADPRSEAELRVSAIAVLKERALPNCRELRYFYGNQIHQSEASHRETLRWIGWGLAGVGAIGSLSAVLLGYSVARRLQRSIYQLSVRIRDATDRLGQTLPTVTLTPDASLQHLDQQMHRLVEDIEKTIQQLQQREREVLRSEQLAAVGQLAAGAAHELRNPLTAIKMLVQTNLEEAEASDLPAEDLQIIEQEIRRMERCLQIFLDFARPPKPQCRPIELRQSVDRTFALVGGRARKQRVVLEFQPPAAPVVVNADEEQIQQLLVNLVLNALDAMPRGGRVTVELHGPSEGQCRLRVLDSGAGISAELLPRLFVPFVSSKETGLGLGLVVSRRIVETHGGSLQACNRSEGGACFTVQLPAEAAVAAAT